MIKAILTTGLIILLCLASIYPVWQIDYSLVNDCSMMYTGGYYLPILWFAWGAITLVMAFNIFANSAIRTKYWKWYVLNLFLVATIILYVTETQLANHKQYMNECDALGAIPTSFAASFYVGIV